MLHIPCPNQHWDAIHDILVQRKATERDLAPEKIWVSNCFGKNSPAKKCRLPKNSAPGNYDIANSAKQKTNGSCKRVCRK